MPRSVRPWLIVVPLGMLGMLGGHELAYALTSTPPDGLHGYLSHVPQVALLLTLLSLVGAAFVERGSRVMLWPFPAVVIVGFIVQEHVERLAHTGSLPLLLDQPFFLAGLALQALVALAVWLLARLLVRLVGVVAAEDSCAVARSIGGSRPRYVAPSGPALAGTLGARPPPLGLALNVC